MYFDEVGYVLCLSEQWPLELKLLAYLLSFETGMNLQYLYIDILDRFVTNGCWKTNVILLICLASQDKQERINQPFTTLTETRH